MGKSDSAAASVLGRGKGTSLSKGQKHRVKPSGPHHEVVFRDAGLLEENTLNAVSIDETYRHAAIKNDHIQLQSRRYIGNKFKLINWIFSVIEKECSGQSFADIFAGTGVVAAVATKHFTKVILNDFLYSNHVIYQAFFGDKKWDKKKIAAYIKYFNKLKPDDIEANYFSVNFGGKYFSHDTAKIIGYVREHIERERKNLTDREYYILLTSLLYSIDKIANTVGHYDAYFKKNSISDAFVIRPIDTLPASNVAIYREDTNRLVREIEADIVYIDPPYNSRQYSRFYHVLETLIKWDEPELFGVALKPKPENVSEYSKTRAYDAFADLIKNTRAKYLVVSYNNTYSSKSSSSKNKITLEQIRDILEAKGKTKIFEKSYRHFSAGNTNFKDHKEYLFVTKVQK